MASKFETPLNTIDAMAAYPMIAEEKIVRRGRGRPPLLPKPLTPEETSAAGILYREHARAAAKKTFDKNIEMKKFVCPICQKAFGTLQSFKYHTVLSKLHK